MPARESIPCLMYSKERCPVNCDSHDTAVIVYTTNTSGIGGIGNLAATMLARKEACFNFQTKTSPNIIPTASKP